MKNKIHIAILDILAEKRANGDVVSVQPQWANSPSYVKGELFYMNMTGISISKQ